MQPNHVDFSLPSTRSASFLARGNLAFREKKFETAISEYVQALQAVPGLSQIIVGNIELARNKLVSLRQHSGPTTCVRVAVCGNLQQSQRMNLLADMYQASQRPLFAGVTLLDCRLNDETDNRDAEAGDVSGDHNVANVTNVTSVTSVTNVVRISGAAAASPRADSTATPVHRAAFNNDSSMIFQALDFVLAHPFDRLHLAGTAPIHMLLGSLYKLVWAAQVLIDIDGDGNIGPLAMPVRPDALLPQPAQWDSAAWHSQVLGWVDEFDGTTVANLALQMRHGGSLLRNVAREADPAVRKTGRARFGLGKHTRVILLLAGVSGSRSILAAAEAIAIMPRNDIVLAVAGHFNAEHAALKTNLEQISNARCLFLEAGAGLEQAAALADAWLLPQQDVFADGANPSIPALPPELGDALARRIPVFADAMPALLDMIALGAVIQIDADSLAVGIGQWLEEPESVAAAQDAGERFFAAELSWTTQLARLQAMLSQPVLPPLNESRQRGVLRHIAAALPAVERAGLLLALAGIREPQSGADADALALHQQRSLQGKLAAQMAGLGIHPAKAGRFAARLVCENQAEFLHQLFLIAIGRRAQAHEMSHFLDGLAHKWNRCEVLDMVFGGPESQTWRMDNRAALLCEEETGAGASGAAASGAAASGAAASVLLSAPSAAPSLAPATHPAAHVVHNTNQQALVVPDANLQALAQINLPQFAKPLVSVIIPVYGKVEYTLMCLASIQKHLPQVSFEVLVVDDKSPDNTLALMQRLPCIKVVENRQNLGFIRSCNHGASRARGKYLCFLNNDTEVTPGWLDALVRTFDDFPGTGLAGSKFIYPDGRLQEAGGILWQDGSAWNYGRLQDPQLPIFNYAREVDYCSGASIMLERSLFDQLGGFDEHYLPAYCEDSDLALKVRAQGLRVIYQPLSTVIHYEGITSGTDTGQGVKAYQVANSKKLFARWQERLQQYQANGQQVDKAKDRMSQYRALVIDHCTPTPNQDAGSVTTYNMLILLREMGFQVTFVPEDNFLYMPEYTTALQRQGIEVLYALYVTSVQQHVAEHGARYDLAFLFRPGVVERHLEVIRKHCPKAKVLFHTIDLHYLRMTREAELLQEPERMNEARAMKLREFAAIRGADASIVHSTAELELLQPELPGEVIHVFPLILDIRGSQAEFPQRHDIVFVGGYQHVPNIDAVQYFVGEIMPLLRRQLPGVRFFAVGSKPPAEIAALAADDVIITGFVEDLPPFLDKIRVSVAPLRYGAGIKGKIGTAMSVGLPTVATTLAVEGMMLTDGENILVADGAQAFADAVTRLYHDEALWQTIQHNALDCAQEQWGANAAWRILCHMLKALGMPVAAAKFPLVLYH